MQTLYETQDSLFVQLSSQGRRNDLIASPAYANEVVNFSVVNDHLSENRGPDKSWDDCA